jgi:XTP/dITP diphosphohydrolase
MKVGVITKNPGKIKIVEYVFPKYGIDFEFIDGDFPEIQAASSKEIAEFTSRQAAKELGMPVVREDASLYIRALGFPGPFTAYLEKMVPAEKLLKILEPFEDRSGFFESAVSFCLPNKTPLTFVERFEIEINDKEAGDLVPPKAWDRILRLKGESRTFAEYPIEERIKIWAKPYEKLAKTIKLLSF